MKILDKLSNFLVKKKVIRIDIDYELIASFAISIMKIQESKTEELIKSLEENITPAIVGSTENEDRKKIKEFELKNKERELISA